MTPSANRIARINAELIELQNDLQKVLDKGPQDSAAQFELHAFADPQMLAEFKITVDQMRHLLWCYVEFAAQDRSATVAHTQRLRLVTELLRVLRAGVPKDAPLPETTFIDQVHGVVQRYLPNKEAA